MIARKRLGKLALRLAREAQTVVTIGVVRRDGKDPAKQLLRLGILPHALQLEAAG